MQGYYYWEKNLIIKNRQKNDEYCILMIWTPSHTLTTLIIWEGWGWVRFSFGESQCNIINNFLDGSKAEEYFDVQDSI